MVNDTTWLWVWYFVVLIVAWIIIWWACRGRISASMAFFAAALFALMVGVILLPYFYHPLLTGGEKASLTAFFVVAVLLPFAGIIVWAILKKGKDVVEKKRAAAKTGIKAKEDVIVENPCTGEEKMVAQRFTCDDGNRVTKIYHPAVNNNDFDVGQYHY